MAPRVPHSQAIADSAFGNSLELLFKFMPPVASALGGQILAGIVNSSVPRDLDMVVCPATSVLSLIFNLFSFFSLYNENFQALYT